MAFIPAICYFTNRGLDFRASLATLAAYERNYQYIAKTTTEGSRCPGAHSIPASAIE
ncbi:hypothetical protein SBV1_2890003 [Verrucomicrobia bacterium]|nr:hypothetical protein SBV1_2890003 [Verrucomicrobiota bacterium]